MYLRPYFTMEPVVRDSFYLEADSINSLTANNPSNFVHVMRRPVDLPDGQFEVGLCGLSCPNAFYNVLETDNAAITFSFVAVSGDSIIVHENDQKTFTLRPGYYQGLQALCDELNSIVARIYEDGSASRRRSVQVDKVLKFKLAYSTHLVTVHSLVARRDCGIRMTFSNKMKALLGFTVDHIDLVNYKGVLYAPAGDTTLDLLNNPPVTSILFDRMVYKIKAHIDIIDEIETYDPMKQCLKEICLPHDLASPMFNFSTNDIEYHRLKTFSLSMFRIILTDQNGKELDIKRYTDSIQSYYGNSFVKLHFRRVGTGFKGVRPEDTAVRINRPCQDEAGIFGIKRKRYDA